MVVSGRTLKTRYSGWMVYRVVDDVGFGIVNTWWELYAPGDDDNPIEMAFKSAKEAKEWAKAHPIKGGK